MPRILIVIVIALPILLWTPVRAANLIEQAPFWENRGLVGANIGFIGKGILHLSANSFNTDPGFTFGVKFDVRMRHDWFLGLSVDVHRIHVLDTGQYFLDASLNFKRMIFNENSQVGIRPGLGFGFGHLTHFLTYESTRYLTCRLTLEIIFFSEGNSAPFIEVGLFGAPIGSNSTLSAHFNPILLGRIGILL